ncbi:prepilin-type N-terminal cleavage/methylation domain-containing protein [Saccharophagus degradans]|uniref:prepilin-type N-terminal cleavage/methylation domain-containing protein n=1 Tax=Saccharophagus degradans TaxID=86304 RepID=UPI0024781A3D|nr:prepilin-type N-terminal cleavage/methylation domain-containing protein [Saccharophagus degradans]WGO97421.1 prepilin-type N-terminal cleavage/methylation domain-containing protein [Saccharophagus degradans]
MFTFKRYQSGVTLIETVVFLVVVSIALVALIRVYTQAVVSSVDPVVQIRALEKAQAQMDEILARKFDENTPTGGVPACDSSTGVACAGISPDADYDDVGDYNGFVDASETNYTVSVSVVNAGSELGLANTRARRITVTALMPGGNSVVLSAYKVNF